MSESLKALVEGSGTWNPEAEALEPGDYTVGAYAWSGRIKFRVRMLESGC